MPDLSDRQTDRVLEGARRKLLETGTRNRLVHVNRANKTGKFLNIINERSGDVFDLLRLQAKRMRFKPMGKDPRPKADEGPGQVFLAIDRSEPDDAPLSADRTTDLNLETPLGPEAQARRLLRLFLDAKTAEEEQGVNILYLALGFLRWRESDSSEVWREAPLILLPVELVRNERSSGFDIRARDDDITTNLPLQERLRTDFGVILPDIDDQEEWTPGDYLAKVGDAVSGRPGWGVEADAIQLGFFSFAKLLMHRDLDVANWPGGALEDHDLLGGLLAEGFDGGASPFGTEDRLDDILDPADIIQVVDADASQTKVIEEVKRGANLVVQGPPGTGKSQTITNIIAAAVHDGKTVLFVAEKMAALSVVHQRLVKTGLRDICLELHSRSANKKALAQELGRTLAASAAALPAATSVDGLRLCRDRLNRIAATLHDPLLPGSSDTPFRAMSDIIGLIGRAVPAPTIPLAGLDTIGPDQRQSVQREIERFVAALSAVGAPEHHPFRGTLAHDLQPTDLARLAGELAQACAAITDLLATAATLGAQVRQPAPETLGEITALADLVASLGGAPAHAADLMTQSMLERAHDPRLAEALAAGAAWAGAREASEALFAGSAWGADLGALRTGIVAGQGAFLSRMFGPYGKASGELAGLLAGPLPQSPDARLALVDRLLQVQDLRRRLGEEEAWLQGVLGVQWRGERTDFRALATVSAWLGDVKRAGLDSVDDILPILAALPDPVQTAAHLRAGAQAAQAVIEQPIQRLRLDLAGADLGDDLANAPLCDLKTALVNMQTNMTRYADWASLTRAIAQMVAAGAEPLVDAVAGGTVAPEGAVSEFLYACAEARWNAARRARPALGELAGHDRHDLVELFKLKERNRLVEAQHLILARHFGQMPRGSQGEMGVIRGEIGRKSRHRSIRWVMGNAGTMVQRIKPVFLMSPISVAQFLPPGKITFDLLVIDEASQIRPEDALGVVARARQIVVVGDQKQLPPTAFFERLMDDTDDPDADEQAPVAATASDMESILTLCEARGLRSRMLEWHYRSRDPSLIQVSNAEFYNHALVLPPSPLQLDDNYGLKFNRVPGVYARGTSGADRPRTNRIEAQAVVAAVAAHARDWPDLSLGVVAFSKPQADMLTETLEFERRSDPVLDAFLREGRSEDLFVKNIENVQGDERDVIFISVGYGPQEPDGRLASQSFGPVNGEGGERRLNVLFSRARVRCVVFASFDPGDIDPSKASRIGPRVLKRFLDFAKSGVMEQNLPTGQAPDSPFEEDVIAVIQGLGYLADPQVGSAGFRIDIGVRHPDRPGQYIAAVECDGAAYHSALWARERDRLRQDVLEGLGWRFHRIWSTDWFHRRDAELNRLAQALAEARDASGAGLRVRGANEGGARPVVAPETETAPPIDIAHLQLTAPPYERSAITVTTGLEPHEAQTGDLAHVISRIVSDEGPIHTDELTRRIATAFGKNRTGSRIAEAVERAIAQALRRDAMLRRDGNFLLTSAQEQSPPVRDRSDETGTLLKAAYLPPMEIRAAAARILAESGGMPPESLVRAVARLLGFQRVGPELQQAIITATIEQP